MPFGGKVTCSFGAGHFRLENDDANSIFERVDKALYKSKNNGKNCVTSEETYTIKNQEILLS